jgi:hypothetical protein
MTYDTAMKKRCFLLEKYPKEYAEAEKINLARYKRVVRLRKRIERILTNSDTVIFLTLTFSDETLAKTSANTRRGYVSRYLSSFGFDYVANIDFGAKNGREHYHAVVGGKVDLELWERKCGIAFAEFVQAKNIAKKVPKRYLGLPPEEIEKRMKTDNEKRLAKYVAKLTNHAIKETTKRSVAIYYSPKKSRNAMPDAVREFSEEEDMQFSAYIGKKRIEYHLGGNAVKD